MTGLVVVAGVIGIGTSRVHAEDCSKVVFESVVGEAASALRSLNASMRPIFQDKLRELKDKRGWSQDEFLTLAAPFVQDERIAEFDETSTDVLSEIEHMGAEGARAPAPDCVRLGEVRARMNKLLEVQKAKWSYMFGKVTAELEK
jgi:hypothetical protein